MSLRLHARRGYIIGVCIAALLAVCALALSSMLPWTVSPVLIAVLLGLGVGNLTHLPPSTRPGLEFTAQRILRLGIVLMGAKLSFADIVEIGKVGLILVVLCMGVAVALVALMGRLYDVPPRVTLLLAVGTAICGNSAIMATAPVIDAEEREVSVAVGTITVFGMTALLLFPIVGKALGMPDSTFGFWAGLSINDTSQVVAAGAAFSKAALETATVVKLVRNGLMAPVILLVSWWSHRLQTSSLATSHTRAGIRRAFPLFVLGFLGVAGLRTLGIIGDSAASLLAEVSNICIALAIAAVGTSVKLADIRAVGAKPFMVGFASSVGLALFGFALAHVAN